MNPCVFVTGATNGTGYAIARRFAREGWDVFLGSREGARAQEAAERLKAEFPVYARGFQTEIFDEENVRAIFEEIRAEGRLLDTLVLNAANLGIGQVSLEVDVRDFMRVYETNVGWNFMMARAAALQMKEKKKGAIVFIASNTAHRVTENRCAYCSSKSAILGMSKSFAVDWGRYGIRSNCVLPGMIKTVRWQNDLFNTKSALCNYTPIGDIAAFEDVANAAWFLGSDQSRNTTGAEVNVDGGMSAVLTPNLDRGPFLENGWNGSEP